MLKIIDYNAVKLTNVEIDVYIPINIEFGTWNVSVEPTIYWRTGDFKKSLIEIGVGKDSGDIRSVTLTVCENVYWKDYGHQCLSDKKRIVGLPIIQTNQENDVTYQDNKGNLEVFLGERTVYIKFSENEVVSFIKNENVEFGIDHEHRICSVLLNGINEGEKSILDEALDIPHD
ncbi:hypothetical protein SAMN04488126_101355 [Bhargavaea beijingensis]|uniref:Uncharacterized protein n=1 Tax=Bhargavaea beijingensis TaxID=426756 RepID=A0A1G6Y9J5_9BACL|nr:hypothetical protein [Bhargavaea beijingensis]SDD86921.1 hypothetical protein SAMN04488126_101355 [Bhargavaea beijingensis]